MNLTNKQLAEITGAIAAFLEAAYLADAEHDKKPDEDFDLADALTMFHIFQQGANNITDFVKPLQASEPRKFSVANEKAKMITTRLVESAVLAINQKLGADYVNVAVKHIKENTN